MVALLLFLAVFPVWKPMTIIFWCEAVSTGCLFFCMQQTQCSLYYFALWSLHCGTCLVVSHLGSKLICGTCIKITKTELSLWNREGIEGIWYKMGYGSGDSSVVEQQIRDWKVLGWRSCRQTFFSRVNFLCRLLFHDLYHPHVTAVAPKRSQSFCQKCRWHITAKPTCILQMWLGMKRHCKLVDIVVWWTDNAKTNSFMWHQPCNTTALTTSVDIQNTLCKAKSLAPSCIQLEHSVSAQKQRIVL